MTEAEWLACDDLGPMLDLLAPAGSERKLRLFACAICRMLPRYLESEPDRQGLELTELDVDGLVPPGAFDTLGEEDYDVRWYRRDGWDAVARACEVYFDLKGEAYFHWMAGKPEFDPGAVRSEEGPVLAGLLREVVGYVGRPYPCIDPIRLAWGDEIVQRLAQRIYDEKAFNELPILADALEEAGCTDEAILTHLRSPGSHVRGCWALDLVLGKS